MDFWLLVFLMVLFGWTGPRWGVWRAEFLRARNFEYVRVSARAGVSDATIMFRHVLPQRHGGDADLPALHRDGHDRGLGEPRFLGFGLPSSAAVAGEDDLAGLRTTCRRPWLAFTAFFAFAIMLSLLVFIFEGVRDAFDPRKTFVSNVRGRTAGGD